MRQRRAWDQMGGLGVLMAMGLFDVTGGATTESSGSATAGQRRQVGGPSATKVGC